MSDNEKSPANHLQNKRIISQLCPLLFLFILLLGGSLINNLPGQNASFVNFTNILKDCLFPFVLTKLELGSNKSNNINLNNNDIINTTFTATTTTTDNLLQNNNVQFLKLEGFNFYLQIIIVVLSLILPLTFYFVKNMPLDILNSKTFLPVYNHLAGQILSFSSGEILRHFLIFPQIDNFVSACNLTEEKCQSHKNQIISTDALCLNMDQKQIFNALHSLPNVLLVMVGAASLSLAKNYTNTEVVSTSILNFSTPHPPSNSNFDVVISEENPSPPFRQYRKINYCVTSQYFKFMLLIIYILVVLIYVWKLILLNFQITDLMLSFGQGLLVQTSVGYAIKNKNIDFIDAFLLLFSKSKNTI